MSNTLYVFIDESGNETQDDYYVVAGCWCVSTETDPSAVLDPTVQRLTDMAESVLHRPDPISELKGGELPNDVLEATVRSFENYMYDDTTIPHPAIPWGIAYPFRFSVSSMNPEVGIHALRRFVPDELDAPKALRVVMLLSALDPLFRDEFLDMTRVDDITVVLDDVVWEGSAQHTRRAFDNVDDAPNTTFTIEESSATPGLQIADLAAYSWARHRRKGDCQEIIEVIDQLRFGEI